jgi:DUF1680 family protein
MPGITESSHARWRTLPLESISLTGGFWLQWQNTNRQVTLAHGYRMLEEAGNLDNFRIAAGLKEGQYRGREFNDSDVYKWLEAVGYELHNHPDAELQQLADEVIDLVAAAQQADGYLDTYYQIAEPGNYWTDLDFGHELYCAGHLFQAAVAYSRATHTTKLLEVAARLADLLCVTFGPDNRQGTSGHPEVEMALVELYRLTGKQAYLDLAEFFIDQRGKGAMRGLGWLGAEYHQDRVPVREASEVEGHAVRAMYLNAGVADLYLETGETALLEALERLWQDMAGAKLFLTGGLGARYEGESFGAPYELPSDQCYCETCAAIGSVMWNWRMLLITGEGRFADLMERTLYNGVLSGLALRGDRFFYMNPLLSRAGYARQPWYEVACCPPNLMRTLASIGGYFVTHDEMGLQLHLYGNAVFHAEIAPGRPVGLEMETDYPWQGQVMMTIRETDGSTWQLRLRVPEWNQDVVVNINGHLIDEPTVESGYVVIERRWRVGDTIELTMSVDPFLVEANPRVDAIRGTVAIQRGPLVYCLEAADNPGVDLLDVQLDESSPLQPSWRDDLLAGGVMTVQASGYAAKTDEWRGRLYRRANEKARPPLRPVQLTAIPYYAWANRSAGAMRVWLPRAKAR